MSQTKTNLSCGRYLSDFVVAHVIFGYRVHNHFAGSNLDERTNDRGTHARRGVEKEKTVCVEKTIAIGGILLTSQRRMTDDDDDAFFAIVTAERRSSGIILFSLVFTRDSRPTFGPHAESIRRGAFSLSGTEIAS